MRIYLTVMVLLCLVACKNNSEESNNSVNNKDEELVVINVETSKSYIGNSIATFRSTAVLEADREATVTTKTSGIILDILVEAGDTVKKDDLLLVLESDTQQLSLNSASANYDKSENNYERAKLLLNKGLTNKEQIDNLKFETLALKSSLEQAKMNLSFTQVKAPFDGVVVKRHVKVGNLIQNATAVFDIIDFNSLQAKINVPEHQLSIMRTGLDVQFEFDALNHSSKNGKVIRISPIIDSNSGTFEVTVSIDNSDMSLRPGLFAKANIIIDQKNDVVLTDKDSIIREDELAFVYVVNEGTKIIKTLVTLGYEMENTYEVISGLNAGQEVVTTGKNNLTPNATVNVVNYDEVL